MSKYLGMSIRELQTECKNRGLPTGRTKDELLVRLVEADALAEVNKYQGWLYTPDLFRVMFSFVGELDDSAHRMFRHRAYEQAKRQGYTPRGTSMDVRRVRSNTIDTTHTYEVMVK